MNSYLLSEWAISPKLRFGYDGHQQTVISKIRGNGKELACSPQAPPPYKLDVSVLEDRILYSATMMPVADASAVSNDGASIDMDALQQAVAALSDNTVAAALANTSADSGEVSVIASTLTGTNSTSLDAASVAIEVSSLSSDSSANDCIDVEFHWP